MERRSFLGRFGLTAAALGAAGSPTSVVAQQADVPNRNSFRTADFGALGNGAADDTAAIQRAIDAAHGLGGGTVFLEGTKGRNFRCAGQISLDNRRGVRIVGSAGPNVSVAGGTLAVAQLEFTGPSAPFISLRSCHSITLEGVKISYSNPQFKGALLSTGHSPEGRADTGYLMIDRCRFTGTGRASSAASLVDLGLCICSTVRNCEFQQADVGVVGTSARGRYSNVIQITDCTFRDLNKVPIKSAGESWLISGCAFEPLANGTGAAYQQGKDSGAWGLVILGCWMGDVAKPGGCWIDITQAPALGISIIGNRMAPAGTGPRDTAIKLGTGNQGVTITGNRIEGAVGIDFTAGYTFGASIIGNDLQCQTPIVNLSNAMSHFVAGHYTFPNKASGRTTFDTATFGGDGVHGSINLAPQQYVPTTPNDGDMWIMHNDLFVRINGQTRRVNLS